MGWELLDERRHVASPMDFAARKEEYCSMKESGYTEVKECEEQELKLPDLYQGTHNMGASKLKCLVYELDKPSYPTFLLLKTIRHPSIVRHETFCEESGKLKAVILSSVDCKLEDLVTPDHASMFFTSTESGRGLTTNFRTMIIDVCSGLEHLFSLDLYPKEIKLSDLYVCKDGPTKKRVQLLILEAKKIVRWQVAQDRRTLLWSHVILIIEKIRENTKSGKLNEVEKRFIQCIGNGVKLNVVDKGFNLFIANGAKMLSYYPYSWSYEQKGRYLISVISANKAIVHDILEKSDLEWPGKATKTPHLLELLIDNASKRPNAYPYSNGDPYGYVLLCRTTFKHFPSLCKEVPALEEMCQSGEDFLKLMEKWNPLIWCILYDAIGLPSSLPRSIPDKSDGSG